MCRSHNQPHCISTPFWQALLLALHSTSEMQMVAWLAESFGGPFTAQCYALLTFSEHNTPVTIVQATAVLQKPRLTKNDIRVICQASYIKCDQTWICLDSDTYFAGPLQDWTRHLAN